MRQWAYSSLEELRVLAEPYLTDSTVTCHAFNIKILNLRDISK